MPFAQIVPIGAPIHREMTYEVPEDIRDSLVGGSRVLIPLGPRWTTGIVVSFRDRCDLDEVRSIGIPLDPYPILSEELLDLCRWVADYYLCTLAEVLKAALPAGIHTDSGQKLALTEACDSKDSISELQREILELLREKGDASVRQLQRRVRRPGVRSAVYGLLRRGSLTAYQKMEDPRVRPKQERIAELILSDDRWFDTELPPLEKRAPRQGSCLRKLRESGGELPTADLMRAGFGPSVIRALVDRSLVRIRHRELRRDPYAAEAVDPEESHPLTEDQRKALADIEEGIAADRFGVHLLRGVTGSGKTLVYIRAVGEVLTRNRGALILVPEISLTPQTVRRFRGHFGDRVAVLHSGLSEAERYDAWREVREGKRNVVVGARSAIFAPVRDLGIIVIDEEHDASYKQADPSPRYNARDVAVMRAKMAKIPVVLGSATPSLESYQNALTGKFNLITMPRRVDDRTLPEVSLVDMKTEAGGIFSQTLRDRMKSRLEGREKIILLQNRRGYAPFVQCTDCGAALECPNCQVTLTYHAHQKRMICHYCGRDVASPPTCESCGSNMLERVGVGTQRVEEALETQFPEARVLRMDVDTTRRKGGHARILDAFKRGEADVLLGTQMVSKGLDFPGVTLVGVISADTSIHLPDFRAAERTFQLLTQVSGRAGRGETPGEVVIQTFLPDAPAIQLSKNHDFEGFAHLELDARSEVGYPPFGRIVLLHFRGPDEEGVARGASLCENGLRIETSGDPEIFGPSPAPLLRLRRNYRWQVILKSASPQRLNRLAKIAKDRFPRWGRGLKVRLEVDVDPVSLL